MDKTHILRALALAGIALAPAMVAQSTLPPTPPTTQQAPLSATPLAGVSTYNMPHRAQVTYDNGLLDVRANDSSLNQILRAISRATGMKITGGVQDQRVFGDYGPATPATVLATLLDGTNTNILLTEGGPADAPELILTPRGGGPTPPNPMSSTDGDTPDPAPVQQPPMRPQPVVPPNQPAPPQAMQPQPNNPPSGPPSMPQPVNNVNGSEFNTSPTASNFPTTNSVPTDTLPTPSTTPSSTGIVDAPNPPAPGSTTGTAPNGTATPEQVYQQLLQLQKQQQSAQKPQ